MNLESRKKRVLKYKLLGMLEALDNVASKLKDPKDILMMDLDDPGKWKIIKKKDDLAGDVATMSVNVCLA